MLVYGGITDITPSLKYPKAWGISRQTRHVTHKLCKGNATFCLERILDFELWEIRSDVVV